MRNNLRVCGAQIERGACACHIPSPSLVRAQSSHAQPDRCALCVRPRLQVIDELAVEGMVDLDDEKAVFMAAGDSNNEYMVTISDAGHTCDCIDHKSRHRDCKHIMWVGCVRQGAMRVQEGGGAQHRSMGTALSSGGCSTHRCALALCAAGLRSHDAAGRTCCHTGLVTGAACRQASVAARAASSNVSQGSGWQRQQDPPPQILLPVYTPL